VQTDGLLASSSYSAIELKAIGRAQKTLILAILAGFVFVAYVPKLGNGAQVMKPSTILSVLVMMAGAYRMARALRKPALLWVVGMCVPVLSLLLCLVLNSEASKALRAAGLNVGLFGVGSGELQRLDQKTD
jgi:ABC-type glycerol-3-phosphate transport system permease component